MVVELRRIVPVVERSTGVLALLGRTALPDVARNLESDPAGGSSSSHGRGAEPTKELEAEQSPGGRDTVASRKRTLPRTMAADAPDDSEEVQVKKQLQVAPSASDEQTDQQKLSEARRRAFPGRPTKLTSIERRGVTLMEEEQPPPDE